MNEIQHCIRSLFYNIEQTARICRTAIEIYFEENSKEDITFDEFIILDTVYCFPEICQRDLAKLILKGTSHTSKFLAVLADKGYIERPVDTKGNRIVKKIVITEKGMDVYKYASKLANEFAQNIEDILGEEAACGCINFLNTIKETIRQTSKIEFE